ncbi:MAG: SMC-Scp complex subunit ScpB [Candidatus Micrarchaeia archaeon]
MAVKEENLIEAALFISAKPLTIAELGRLIGVAAHGYVEGMVKKLAAGYDERESSIQIVFEDGKYLMRVRREYLDKVKPFAQSAEISSHALKTLAYINNREGVLKSSLVKQLGDSVYQDVKELVEKGFVTQKKAGRSKSLHTTDKFKEYFSKPQ